MTTSPLEPVAQVHPHTTQTSQRFCQCNANTRRERHCTIGIQLIRLIVGLVLLLQAGCFNASPDDQELPWSRPADWEGGVPGMGN